jgi:KDO2-lipid IV(A) lauroyltransferase
VAKKARNQFIDFSQYVALRLVNMALHCFPVEMNLQTARLIGSTMYLFDKKHRDRAQANLRRSFPEMPEHEVRRMARLSMQQLIMLFVEVLFTPRLIRIDTWRRYIRLHNFESTIELLIRRKPLIMVTGHYGNWEILGYALATLGYETTSVARPLDNPYVNEWLLGVRERMGQRIIDKKGAIWQLPPIIQSGTAVGFIADQNAGSKGMFVEFFGRLASSYKSIGLLAMQYDAPIIIGYARRTWGKFLFEIGVQDVIYPDDWKKQDDPLRYITQRYTRGIEAFVREDPGQYLWVHRRWKTRPKGEEPERYD